MKIKKLIICILATAILFNTNCMSAFAAEVNTTEKTIIEETATLKDAIESTKTINQVNACSVKSYTKSDLKLLACLIQAEAGNQSYKGKLAVANVVLNRLKSSKFSHVNTIKEVIYDKKWSVQFTVSVNGMLAKELKEYSGYSTSAEKLSIKAAKAALQGENNIGDYLSFTRYTSSLAKKHPDHKKIGNHIFF